MHGFASVTDQTIRMSQNFENMFNLAMEYTGNDAKKSNMLVLQYFRKRGNYGGSLFSNSNSSNLTWNTVAGAIDNNYCNLIDTNLSDMNLNYYDPATPNHYKYDINHLCAVANALLYELGDSEESGMDILTNLYSGWGGDMLSFAIDVKEAENNGVTDIEEWAKDNICQSNSHFPVSDYYGDIDAINIVNLMNELKINFHSAFRLYFKTPLQEKSYAETRATRYINSVGSTSYIEWACDLLNSDEFDIFKYIIGEGTMNQKYYDAAIAAFKGFIYSEYVAGR